MDPQHAIKKLFQEAQNDPNILGLYYNGSRGKGMVTEYSDYDLDMIVSDGSKEEYQKKFGKFGKPNIEICVMTLDELKKDGEFGSNSFWNRYAFAHLKPELDKTGQLQTILDEKTTIPPDKRENYINSALDHYINQVYRSVKCFRDGKLNASHLEAAESVQPLLNAFFALEGRMRPYHKYLEWELVNYPLAKLPWNKDTFLNTLLTIIKTADIKTQQETVKTVEKIFRKEGFNQVFDAWEEKLPWMENY